MIGGSLGGTLGIGAMVTGTAGKTGVTAGAMGVTAGVVDAAGADGDVVPAPGIEITTVTGDAGAAAGVGGAAVPPLVGALPIETPPLVAGAPGEGEVALGAPLAGATTPGVGVLPLDGVHDGVVTAGTMPVPGVGCGCIGCGPVEHERMGYVSALGANSLEKKPSGSGGANG